jgi:hypothetical protein
MERALKPQEFDKRSKIPAPATQIYFAKRSCPIIGNIFALSKLFGSRDVNVMSNLVKKNLSEQRVTDRGKFHRARALRNNVVNKQIDVSGPTVPRLRVVAQSFFGMSRSTTVFGLPTTLFAIQASSVGQHDLIKPNKVFFRNS